MKADLHLHTNYSDGTDSPSDVRLADESAIRRLAVTYALGTDAIGRNDKPAGLAY